MYDHLKNLNPKLNKKEVYACFSIFILKQPDHYYVVVPISLNDQILQSVHPS